MKRICITLLFAPLSFTAISAEITQFRDGEVASAAEINQNFNNLASELPPTNCQTDQIIRWNGSAWECATDSADLVCETGDLMQYLGDAWGCLPGYTVGGEIRELQGTVTLSLNGIATSITESGVFTFPNKVHGGNLASVSVVSNTDPEIEKCVLVDGATNIVNEAISNVKVSCFPIARFATENFNGADFSEKTFGDQYEVLSPNIDPTLRCDAQVQYCHLRLTNWSPERKKNCKFFPEDVVPDYSCDEIGLRGLGDVAGNDFINIDVFTGGYPPGGSTCRRDVRVECYSDNLDPNNW